MRRGETHGVDYNFIDEYTFDEMNHRGLFKAVETYPQVGWNYGTTTMSWGRDRVFILPPSVLMEQLSRQDLSESFVLFLDIAKSTREARLMERCDADSVERRLCADLMDFALFKTYDWRLDDPAFDAEEVIASAMQEISPEEGGKGEIK
jgi:guanylate kinase